MPGAIEKKFIDELQGLVKEHPEIELTGSWKKRGLPEEFTDFEGGVKFSYEPDIVVKVNGKITHIIEVETDPVRKALVGGACTAAYFIDKNLKRGEIKLYFAIGKKDEEYKQLKNLQARLRVINRWCKDIFCDVKIDKYAKVMVQLKTDLGI